MTLDTVDIGVGDSLAVMAGQFGQLAMALADHADLPLTQQRMVDFAVRGVSGAEQASVTVVNGNQNPRTTAQTDQRARALPAATPATQRSSAGPRINRPRSRRTKPRARTDVVKAGREAPDHPPVTLPRREPKRRPSASKPSPRGRISVRFHNPVQQILPAVHV